LQFYNRTTAVTKLYHRHWTPEVLRTSRNERQLQTTSQINAERYHVGGWFYDETYNDRTYNDKMSKDIMFNDKRYKETKRITTKCIKRQNV
jgi:hypothetical protein